MKARCRLLVVGRTFKMRWLWCSFGAWDCSRGAVMLFDTLCELRRHEFVRLR